MKPVQLRRLLQEGTDLQATGKLREAAESFARVRQQEPRDSAAWHLGGNIALLQGNPAAAAELYARALRLNPKSAVIATCLGVAHLALGQTGEAEKHLRTALRLEPKNAAIWDQLATLLSSTGRYEEAVTCHQQAVTIGPKSAQAWHGYGATLANINQTAQALACEQHAIAADPAYAPARRGYALTLQKCHRVPEAVHEFEVLLAQNPRQLELQSHRLFALNYLAASTPASLFAAHQAYGAIAESSVTPAVFTQTPDPERKLRVAFFSADFREHSVAYFMEPLLQHLDRSQFEIIIYSTCARPDAVTTRFRALADLWLDCPSQVENVIEPIIRADQPDIAVDLAGHTGNSLLPVFARCVAPVQINYLGYPNTTGLRAMDFRFVDALTDPPGDSDRYHTETLVRFAPTAWAYSAPTSAPAATPPPSLSRGRVTFGSFNTFSKVTDEMLGLWARLLAMVPGSRLLLKSIGLTDPAIVTLVQARMQRTGLARERVDFAGLKTTTAEHLAAYSQVDIALDPSPYNGTTTTCEALWMGVPVVTLQGDRHASRVGASLLHAIGHPELIAESEESYLTLAANLAADPARLTSLRENLRADMQRSVLMDHAGQAARFGTALRECWRQWCAAKQ